MKISFYGYSVQQNTPNILVPNMDAVDLKLDRPKDVSKLIEICSKNILYYIPTLRTILLWKDGGGNTFGHITTRYTQGAYSETCEKYLNFLAQLASHEPALVLEILNQKNEFNKTMGHFIAEEHAGHRNPKHMQAYLSLLIKLAAYDYQSVLAILNQKNDFGFTVKYLINQHYLVLNSDKNPENKNLYAYLYNMVFHVPPILLKLCTHFSDQIREFNNSGSIDWEKYNKLITEWEYTLIFFDESDKFELNDRLIGIDLPLNLKSLPLDGSVYSLATTAFSKQVNELKTSIEEMSKKANTQASATAKPLHGLYGKKFIPEKERSQMTEMMSLQSSSSRCV